MTPDLGQMSFAIVGPTHPYKGGIAQHTTELAYRLDAAGVATRLESWKRQYPRVLYPGQLTVDEPETEIYPGTTHTLSWNRPDTWYRTGRSLRSVEAMVVVMTTPIQEPALEVLVRAFRGRRSAARRNVVLLAHNVLPHEARRFDPHLVRRLISLASGVLVHSDDEARTARRLGAQRCAVAPLPFFFPARPSPPPDPVTTNRLCFAGFVRPYKGLDVLLRAMAKTRTTPVLEVVGEFWDDVEEYHRLADQLGLGDRVQLRPGYASADDLVACIDRSDALVLPYRSGTGSQQPRIAFLRGTPVIATRVGDLPTQVTHDLDGLVCEPGDPAALAASIDELYTDRTLERLRSNVRPPDVDVEWNRYLQSLAVLAHGA